MSRNTRPYAHLCLTGFTEIIRQVYRFVPALYPSILNTHGKRRSNEDKRRAVELLLRDAEWSQWSNNEIAKTCRVSDYLVAELRSSLPDQEVTGKRTYTDRWGNQATMDTRNIGRPTATLDPGPDVDEETGGILAFASNPARHVVDVL